ncbi:MAG: hypothetical protein FJX77_10130 [Armatimonadetes bacterium]|nr:hypothetical protein [Armatimonadota bacterium]
MDSPPAPLMTPRSHVYPIRGSHPTEGAFNQLWPHCHSVPGAYFWLGTCYTGGAAFSWLREQWGRPDPEADGEAGFEELIRQAAAAPPGSEGFFFLPWLQGSGTPHPDAAARGGWLGLTLHHTRAHLIRAVLEGIVFDLRQILDCLVELGLPLTEVRLGEGAARSDLWKQMQAEVLNRSLRLLETRAASPLGAAILAGVAGGVFPDFASACERAVRIEGELEPDPAVARAYETAYREFRSFYPTLSPWFHRRRR